MRNLEFGMRNPQTCVSPFALCCLLFFLVGCAPVQTRFEILSFKDQANQNLYAEHFADGAFSMNARKDTTIVFEIRPDQAGRSLFEPPKTGDTAVSQPAQIVRIEVFWKPRPGTTYADSTQTNADIVYCLISGRHAITYEGAGFVYFTRSWDGKSIRGQVESSILVPTHVQGQPNDLFGPCHLKGTFAAREDRRRSVEVEQRLRGFATSRPAAATNPAL